MTHPEDVRSLEVRIKRLRYQAWHRGCKETDVILGRFCDVALKQMDINDVELFERFLEEDDHDIWQWVAFGAPCPPHYTSLVHDIRHKGAPT